MVGVSSLQEGWYMRLIGWAMVVCCLGEEDGGRGDGGGEMLCEKNVCSHLSIFTDNFESIF